MKLQTALVILAALGVNAYPTGQVGIDPKCILATVQMDDTCTTIRVKSLLSPEEFSKYNEANLKICGGGEPPKVGQKYCAGLKRNKREEPQKDPNDPSRKYMKLDLGLNLQPSKTKGKRKEHPQIPDPRKALPTRGRQPEEGRKLEEGKFVLPKLDPPMNKKVARAEQANPLPRPDKPTFPGTAKNCNGWYTIKSGNDCESVPKMFGISKKQFLEWNPAIKDGCKTNFWVNYSYCVRLSSKKRGEQVLPSSPTSTSSSVTGGKKPVKLLEGCARQWFVGAKDTCESIAAVVGISVEELIALNPKTISSCNTMTRNTYVCLVAATTTTSSSSPSVTPIRLNTKPKAPVTTGSAKMAYYRNTTVSQ
ncbi:hypothetical protein AJ79_05836 [Helicocarpus griseus UAMH5409]|uniref:LysM domain-containing protein n=1 Tax=Helicocarpus griseus UAMH5409 TaxID=1447875 RepID=A0A2B7XJH7_9EURO|nr:hypothetical protein AJ79_05836 [Helicocarpus griseus UAMH5409]